MNPLVLTVQLDDGQPLVKFHSDLTDEDLARIAAAMLAVACSRGVQLDRVLLLFRCLELGEPRMVPPPFVLTGGVE